MLPSGLIFATLFAQVANAQVQEDGVRIAAIYSGRAAHIETVGRLYNDTEEPGSGSGLLIGNRHVLTNNHVIPNQGNYKSLLIQVRLKSRNNSPQQVVAVERDAERDLALLTLAAPVQNVPSGMCPMPIIRREQDAPMGTMLYVLGFPLNQDLGIKHGLLSGYSSGSLKWETENLITYGHSGSPMFDRRGALVGIAVAGIGKFKQGNEIITVAGINFLIPMTALLSSPLSRVIAEIPQPVRCLRDFDGSQRLPDRVPELPPTLARSYTFSQTKDDHPVVFGPHSRVYEQRYAADPGYQIQRCTFTPASANNATDSTCNVEPGGQAAVFKVRLTSGPTVDRYRGWWSGTISVDQLENKR